METNQVHPGNHPYNFDHFALSLWDPIVDGRAVPGSVAPDFTLRSVDGEMVQLSQLRGTPVAIEFGAIT